MTALATQEFFGLSSVGWANATECIAAARRERGAGRLANAWAWLELGRTRFPDDTEFLIEIGWLSQIMGDWVAAAASWAQVRERVPHHIVGFVNGATAAREQGLFGQAEALLVEATQRFPDQAAPWIERAQLAQQRQDWDEASRRWAYVCERFPTVSSSFIGAAKALREQRRFDEASAMLRAALDRFPGDKVVLAEWCWVAQVARDWPEAERRWCILRQDAPDLPVGYTAGAVAFRELRQHEAADALINEAIAKFASERSVWVERAWLASARRDWLEAAKRWADVRARFPEFAEAYLRGAMALSESWDFGAAETLLRDALLHFPDDSDIAVEYAALALRQSQLDEAAARFAHVREKFPHCAEGHLGAATIFRNRFRLSEAAEVLEAAQVLLPDEPRLLLDHALLPVFAPMKSDRDPEETLRRLAILRERFPNFEQGTLASLRQLREAGQLDEAAALARETAGRSASSPAILNEAGAIAVARGELQEASSWYQAAMERFPTDAGGFIGQAQLSRATGRLEAAEAELRHVMDRFPGAAAAYTAYGEIAMQREDWAEAMARWSAASQRFPDDKSFVQRLFDVRLNLAGEEGASAVEGEAAPHDDADPRAATRDLVMQFESLGGRGIGCEFGMFQREFGAEPLGLLRWADMPFEGIVRVLESRFAGVGHPDNTEVFVNRENARPEYCTRDTRGFMFMRCFVYEDEMPMERMRKQALRRIGYLKDKLIEDLESGSKIFIWRCTERTLRDEEIARLHRAVRAYGDNMLMYVRLMDNDHENGSVELVSPGLMVGYMDRFKMSPEGVLASNPASASWLQLCRNAAVRWRETSI